MVSSWRRFNASNLVYRKEQLLSIAPAHLGANAVFTGTEMAEGRAGAGNFGELDRVRIF